jgi:hypothetical protein
MQMRNTGNNDSAEVEHATTADWILNDCYLATVIKWMYIDSPSRLIP